MIVLIYGQADDELCFELLAFLLDRQLEGLLVVEGKLDPGERVFEVSVVESVLWDRHT